MNNLQKRVLSALLLGILFILAIWWHPISMFAVMGVILGLSLWELGQIWNVGRSDNYALLGVLIYILTYFAASQLILPTIISIIILVATINTLFVINYFIVRHPPRILSPIAIYLSLAMSCVHYFQFSGETHYKGLLLILFLLWASDIGAYFIGKNFGKRKLFSSLSPNKTIEGFWGGLALNFLVCLFLVLIQDMNVLVFFLGLIVHIFSVVGDLFESKIKRIVHVKDSSSLIPGHGGMFDRFDGFFYGLPPAIVFYHFILL